MAELIFIVVRLKEGSKRELQALQSCWKPQSLGRGEARAEIKRRKKTKDAGQRQIGREQPRVAAAVAKEGRQQWSFDALAEESGRTAATALFLHSSRVRRPAGRGLPKFEGTRRDGARRRVYIGGREFGPQLGAEREDAPRLGLFEREASQAHGSTYRSSITTQRAGLRFEVGRVFFYCRI